MSRSFLFKKIHNLFQQRDQNPITTLDLAMIEGCAEFVSYQVTDKRTIPETWTYGLANETSLTGTKLAIFLETMALSDIRKYK